MRIPIVYRLVPAIGFAAVLTLASLVPVSQAATEADVPATLTISAGAESPGGDVQLNAFAPHTITISTGDSVTWRVDSAEFHTVHFLSGSIAPEFVMAEPTGVFFNPAVVQPSGGSSYDGTGVAGSGLITQGETYTLNFSQPGTYEYVCLIHPGMKGTIVVKDGRDGTDSQASVDARRNQEVNAELAAHGIPLIMNTLGLESPEGVSATIAAGAGDDLAMVARFLPERVTVKAGDSVRWIWTDPGTPHTVSFLDGQVPPETVLPELQADGPPKLRLNPAVLEPAGDPSAYSGGLLSSGFLDPTQPNGTPSFTVRFDQPGTYEYVCMLHEGMTGTIVVEG
jgi:plastocyanin